MADSWTRDDKLVALMRLPWDVQVTTEADGSLFAKVAEVPDAVADGATEHELAKELWDSLYQSLAVRLDRGDDIPLPAGKELPWLAGPPVRRAKPTSVTAKIVHKRAVRARHAEDAAGDFELAVA